MGEGQGVSPSTPLPHARALASQALTRSAVRFSHFISRLESFIRLSGRGENRKGRRALEGHMWTKKRAISIPSGGLTYNAVALQSYMFMCCALQ